MTEILVGIYLLGVPVTWYLFVVYSYYNWRIARMQSMSEEDDLSTRDRDWRSYKIDSEWFMAGVAWPCIPLIVGLIFILDRLYVAHSKYLQQPLYVTIVQRMLSKHSVDQLPEDVYRKLVIGGFSVYTVVCHRTHPFLKFWNYLSFFTQIPHIVSLIVLHMNRFLTFLHTSKLLSWN